MEKVKLLFLCIVVSCFAAAGTVHAEPYFSLESQEDWTEAMNEGHIKPLTSTQWDEYMSQYQANLQEGEPYPNTSYVPPELYVFGGGGAYGDYSYPGDPGLVMAWGSDTMSSGTYASAWTYDYGLDPDLSTSTILRA